MPVVESSTPQFSQFSADSRPSDRLAAIKDWCLARSDEWYALGETSAARDFLKHAAAVDTKDARVWIALGSLEYELRRFEQAALAFLRAGQLDASNPRVYLHLGLAHQQLGHIEESKALFRHALALAPDNALAMNLLGTVLMNEGRNSEALPLLEASLKRQPENVELSLRLENLKVAKTQ